MVMSVTAQVYMFMSMPQWIVKVLVAVFVSYYLTNLVQI